jgi:Domain of unknown function (DUF4388)/HDOD domain
MKQTDANLSDHFRGRLEVFGLADLLQWMELNRRSGRLTLTRGRDRRTLDWREGGLVYVSGSLPRHRLGVHLLRSGALSAATLYELLARNFTSRDNLTRLILDAGYDTLDGLSLRVEDLARRLLFEMFEWREAEFAYDPDHRVQPILRIGLSLRGQAVAFHGAKKLDDTVRRRRGRRETANEEDDRDALFSEKETEERFWEALERVEGPVEPEEIRRGFERLREFAGILRRKLDGAVSMRPVYEDTAVLLAELLKRSPVDPDAVIPIAALDPNLTLDLLILANALSVDRENAVGTVPEAIARLGGRAVTVLIDRLSAPDFPRTSSLDRAARALRRAGVAAAVAAGRHAERFGIARERGYTLGLLHALAYADLFESVVETHFPPGPFRAAMLEGYRAPVACARSEAWSLPLDFQAALSDDGADPSAAAALVRVARSCLPGCAIGPLPAEEPEPLSTEEIAREVDMVFEFLRLEPARVRDGEGS